MEEMEEDGIVGWRGGDRDERQKGHRKRKKVKKIRWRELEV